MSNSKLIKQWFESTKLPIGFSFQNLSKMLDGLNRLDVLCHNGLFRLEALNILKRSYLRKFE